MQSVKNSWLTWILVSLSGLLVGCDDNAGITGSWKGTVVTESINVGLEMNVVSPGNGDAGDWKFIGAGDQVLNQGDLQAWPPAGDDVVVILIQGAVNQPSGNPATLYGTLSSDGNKIKGEYALLGPGGHGGFEVTRQ